MAVIISCLNLKGGFGKSTTIVNLGRIIADKKLKPILIDLDGQQSATRWTLQGGDKFTFPVISLSVETASRVKGKCYYWVPTGVLPCYSNAMGISSNPKEANGSDENALLL